ncbi:hypothetical protein LNP05_21000 [Klebsiella pneumoniae subsp. pneumoniae]|nr:hypothetical protein [Klebsiella pneumoniae subsp. pneumoniae]
MINRIVLPAGLYPLLALSGGITDFCRHHHLPRRQRTRRLSLRLSAGQPADPQARHPAELRRPGVAGADRHVPGAGPAGDALDLLPIAIPALLLSMWMIFIARPLSVFAGLLPLRGGFNLR